MVSNFTSPHALWTFGHDQTSYHEAPLPYFCASLDLPPSTQDLTSIRSTGILSAGGIDLGEVAAVEHSTPCPAFLYDDPNGNFYVAIHRLGRRYCLDSYGDYTAFITAFFRTISAGSRRVDTRDFLSDSYVRGCMYDFIRATEIGDEMQRHNVDCATPENQQDRYIDPEAHTRYGTTDTPVIGRQYTAMAKFACTNKGRMALVPAHTAIGDRVCILFGCSSPILLTQSTAASGSRSPRYQVRGEVYMDGVMRGDAVAAHIVDGTSSQIFDIV